MSNQSHYQQLGLTEDASFDEIQTARDLLKKQHSGDQKSLQNIEAAYDAILMDRLRLRQEGKIKVPERIRFPERSTQTSPPQASESTNKMPSWLENLIDTPSRADILWPGGGYLALAAISVYASTTSVLQLTLALGVGGCLYFLNRKENKFGRSVLLSAAALILGLLLGGILGPLAPATGLSLEIFITTITFLVLWLVSAFLR
ncbi:MAG: CPP1-like family protein [Cyanobacteriota bacterium]|nr:CPP1-like family protein [Cyanobacteriota bacterium]